MTFQVCPPNLADAHGQHTHVSGSRKSHLLPIIQWEVQGQERSSVIATLAPGCEINTEAASPGNSCHQQGLLGREGGAACCRFVP